MIFPINFPEAGNLDAIADTVAPLAKHDRYLAAFIFELREPFIKVIVDGDNCVNLAHIAVGDEMVGISFVSFAQFEKALIERRAKNARPSMLDNSRTLFDNTGRLELLRAAYTADRPNPPAPSEHQEMIFSILHADNKISMSLAKDELLSAQLGFHVGINDLLKMHYRLHTQWTVNDRWALRDLHQWDPALEEKLARFLSASDVRVKYQVWKEMIDYVLLPMGGTRSRLENNCGCESCRQDLELLATGI